MKLRYKFAIGGFLSCAILFWMSGAPLQRGWGLWGAGVATICVVLMSMAIGRGLEKDDDNEWGMKQ